MILMGYSGAQGTLVYEKNLKSKISCQTPFKLQSITFDNFQSFKNYHRNTVQCTEPLYFILVSDKTSHASVAPLVEKHRLITGGRIRFAYALQ